MTTDEELLAMVEAVTARPGHTSAAGTRVLDVERGAIRLAVDRRADLLQFAGYFHGGVIAGLADHAAGGAVTTCLPPDKFVVTINMTTNFYGPADGDVLLARATATHVGKSIAHAVVDIATRRSDGPEQRCANTVVTFRVIDRPPPIANAADDNDTK